MDLSGISDESSLYSWLYFDKQTSALIKLWLCSTDSSAAVQERYFEQGYLKFSSTQATFIEKFNSAQFSLENKTGKDYPNKLTHHIENYLKDIDT